MRTVLISGAGIAGTTLAYWLARHGYRPTVVERAGATRSSGSPVDVRGPAVDVADRMGVLGRLRELATDVTELTFVNARGKRVGRVSMRAFQGSAGDREVEVARGDLAGVLEAAARDSAEFVFGDSIASLAQDAGGVDVTFEQGAPQRYDLVFGADGLHSTVRRLAFGPEPEFVRHLGIYVATLPLPGLSVDPRAVVMFNAPGRAVSVHPGRGEALAAFMFRGTRADFDHRDTAQHKRLLTEAYAAGGWRVPELLERVRAADDLFFDSVSQVRLPTWSHGRIAVLGDAASCVSLFGDGSTLAMAGAYTLAEQLAGSPGDHAAALRRYEAAQRILVEPKLNGVARASAMMVPATRAGIAARNVTLRTASFLASRGPARRSARGRPAGTR